MDDGLCRSGTDRSMIREVRQLLKERPVECNAVRPCLACRAVPCRAGRRVYVFLRVITLFHSPFWTHTHVVWDH